MRVLAFDTSSAIASVAITDNRNLLFQIHMIAEEKHGETLLSRIEEVLKKVALDLTEIDLIAVGIGPGSFTGVRIGLATAKGISLVRMIPIIGVDSLRVLARGAASCSSERIAAVKNAYRGEVYLATYTLDPSNRLTQILAPRHVSPESAAEQLCQLSAGIPILLCGDGVRKTMEMASNYPDLSIQMASPAHDNPKASDLAIEAENAFREHGASDLSSLEPIYVRPSDAKLPEKPLKIFPNRE